MSCSVSLAVVLSLLCYMSAYANEKVTIPDVHIGRIEGKGMFVHVSCFSSDSSAKVQWFSTDITEDTPPVPVVSTPDNVLVVDLFNLSATNLIDYHCIANNSFGAARTVPFRAYRPPPRVDHIVEVPVVAGQVVVLSCNPTRIFPEPEVLWYIKNFVDSTLINIVPVHTIPCSQKYRTINDGHDLVINDITANDIYSLFFNGTKSGDIILASKVYACAAFYTRLNSNRGYYIFPRYKLKIVDSLPGDFYPYFTPRNKVILSNETSQQLSFFYIAVGDGETLDAVGYPSSNHNTTISVTYDGLRSTLLDEVSVTYDGLPSEVLDDLSVTLALESDSEVLNGSKVTANITIIDPLTILPTTPSGIIYVTVGESVAFNCTASGTDVLVTWYQNASEILNYNESLFTIDNAVLEDSSVYQCIWYSEAQDLYEKATWGLVVNLPVMINATDYNVTTTATPTSTVGNNVVAIAIPLVLVGVLVLLLVLCLVVTMVKMVRTGRGEQHYNHHRRLTSIRKINQAVNEYVRNRLFTGGANKRTFVKPEYLPHLSSIIVLNRDLRMLDIIGQGEFGVVYKAHTFSSKASNERTLVAVKTLKGTFTDESVNELIQECLQMKEFQHPNVMNLLGVCLDAGSAPYLILPYMENGNLLSYLKNNRDNLTLSKNCDKNAEEVSSVRIKLISMCLQVAKGMEYLAMQKLVHRDLAARNCMIDETGIIKVADFGLSESVYDQLYFRQDASDNVKLPIKWLAIESIEDGVFSEKTDVWAFGVTCWEIFSGGKVPYGGLSPLSIPKLLKDGERMEQPDNAACSDYVYKTLMEQCWHGNPDKRPTFSQLQNEISLTLTNMAGYLEFSTISLTVTEDTLV